MAGSRGESAESGGRSFLEKRTHGAGLMKKSLHDGKRQSGN